MFGFFFKNQKNRRTLFLSGLFLGFWLNFKNKKNRRNLDLSGFFSGFFQNKNARICW